MTSGEVGLLSLLKFLWVLLMVPIGWIWTKMLNHDKKFEDTYTKKETQHLIELVIIPVKDSNERLISANRELIAELREVSKGLNQVEIKLAALDERYRK